MPSFKRTKGSPLETKDAVMIWVMHKAGWKQHDIAAAFGLNQGRIAEVLNGKRFPGTERAYVTIDL